MTLVAKKVALGVTGGIAAYKVCELIRELRKLGAEVRVAMTSSAEEFITELTLATLSEKPVMTDLFSGNEAQGTVHIDLARWCDVFVVCPATANMLAKVATGMADDAVTTSILATKAPVVFCPAMNSVMWEKQSVQDNVARLREFGYDIVAPEWGALATTEEGKGWGRLASIASILHKIKTTLHSSRELAGKKVIVTAGPTREPLDPVRFITNYSSGKMGFALAEAAFLKGAEVVLISGPNNLTPLPGIKYVEIETVDELKEAVSAEYSEADILLMAAAVSDYKPASVSGQKLKKDKQSLTLKLTKTSDVLAELGKRKQRCIHVGFAVETENGTANALQKINKKNLDMVVLNNPLEEGAAFGGDTNIVTLIDRNGHEEKLPKMSKFEVAEAILNRAQVLLNKNTHKRAAN